MLTRELFRIRCTLWAQVGMMVVMMPEFEPGAADHLGHLCGRLIRYARTFEPESRHEMELVEDAICQVKRAFEKLAPDTRATIRSTVGSVIDGAQWSSAGDKELIRLTWDAEWNAMRDAKAASSDIKN